MPAAISMTMIAATTQSTIMQKGRPPTGVGDEVAAVLPEVFQAVTHKADN